MKPITRYERYLAAISSDPDANGIDSPETRIEQYLTKIAGESTPIPDKPLTRIEQYLAKIAGEDVEIPSTPISRVEMFLEAIANGDAETPEPLTREEYYLSLWATEGSGTLKTVTGTLLHILDALAKPAVSFEVGIEPQQDLHGQEAPYPAGGGKNIADYPTMISTGAVEQTDGSLYVQVAPYFRDTVIFQNDGTTGQFAITFTWKNNGTSRGLFPVIRYTDSTERQLPVNTGSTTYLTVSEVTDASKTLDKIYFHYGNNVETWFYIQVEKGNTATAWSPYSNECPITGWTGVDVGRTGKNLVSGIVEYGSIDSSGKIVNTSTWQAPYDMAYGYVIEGETYTISTDDTSGFVGGYYSDVPTMSATSDGGTRIIQANKTFTATKTGYLAFRTNHGYPTPQLELGSSASEFEAYQGTTIPITFPDAAGTVYGCTLTLEDGVWGLIVNKAEVDMGTLNWNTMQSFPNVFYTSLTGKADGQFNLISSIYKTSDTGTLANVPDKSVVANLTGTTIYAKDTDYSDKTTFTQAVSGQQLVYELATPIEYTLTETQALTLLKGENNIWSSITNGELSLTYKAQA